jgi:hypothetical protein
MTKSIVIFLALILVADVIGFLGWAMSGQKPIDNLYLGTVTTHVVRQFTR